MIHHYFRFAGKALRQYGSASLQTEEIVQDEMRELVKVFKQYDGQPMDPAVHMLTTVVNALAATVRKLTNFKINFIETHNKCGNNVLNSKLKTKKYYQQNLLEILNKHFCTLF